MNRTVAAFAACAIIAASAAVLLGHVAGHSSHRAVELTICAVMSSFGAGLMTLAALRSRTPPKEPGQPVENRKHCQEWNAG